MVRVLEPFNLVNYPRVILSYLSFPFVESIKEDDIKRTSSMYENSFLLGTSDVNCNYYDIIMWDLGSFKS